MERNISELKQEVRKLRHRNDHLENRSRCQNLRIIGNPEGAENGNPNAFMASFLTKVLGEGILSPLVLSHAHRSLRAPQTLHDYSDKENILQLSGNKGESKFREARIHIFPDMSSELCSAGVRYGVL